MCFDPALGGGGGFDYQRGVLVAQKVQRTSPLLLPCVGESCDQSRQKKSVLNARYVGGIKVYRFLAKHVFGMTGALLNPKSSEMSILDFFMIKLTKICLYLMVGQMKNFTQKSAVVVVVVVFFWGGEGGGRN